MAKLRIGDLARLGGVSVRMLRHYHEIALLEPAEIDSRTGYRMYNMEQVEPLQKIVALKSVGVSLDGIRRALDPSDPVRVEDILRDQRAVVEGEIATANSRLEAIDHLLADTHKEHAMTERRTASTSTVSPGRPRDLEVELKPIAGRLVAQLSAVAESWAPEHIGPVIQPLYPELTARLAAASIEVTGPSTAWYEDTADGRVAVHATLTIGEVPPVGQQPDGLEILELPAIELAATTIHRGTMDNCDETYRALLAWLDAEGHRPIGYSRELDIECGPGDKWVTELQLEIAVSSLDRKD